MTNATSPMVKEKLLFVANRESTLMNSDDNVVSNDKRRESISTNGDRPTEIEIYNIVPSYNEDLSKIVENHTLIYKNEQHAMTNATSPMVKEKLLFVAHRESGFMNSDDTFLMVLRHLRRF